MLSRMIGGILLIIGTSIGAGMLALPVANAATGFWTSSLYFVGCWALMTLGAFYILEVNLYLPRGKNMVSMAHATLGKAGLLVAWFSYLFLLYSLLSAYISGGADVFTGLLSEVGLHLSFKLIAIIFTGVFGFIVYKGIRQVDLLNRVLMFAKLGIYLLLVILIAPKINMHNLQFGDASKVTSTIMLLITSFGFAIIVPNLREYFEDDIARLKRVILIGSLIPLTCYFIWDAVILGTLPSSGPDGIATLMHSDHTTSGLAEILARTINNTMISSFFNFFTSICMLTAFLGVSLCLISFLGDGFNMYQQGKQGLFLFLATFLPPLIIVMYYPGAYIYALNYAGYFCVILLMLLPAVMSLFGRKHFQTKFIVPGGIALQLLLITCSVGLILVTL